MKEKKKIIIVLVVLLAIGFAAVSTTLVISGIVGIANKKDDFKIIFTDAKLDNVERKDFIDEETKQTIVYETNKLTMVNETSVLDYEVTNTSRNYDGEVVIECSFAEEDEIEYHDYIGMEYEPKYMIVEAGKVKTGSVTAKLKKASAEDKNIKIICTLSATAIERDKLGDEVEVKSSDYLMRTQESTLGTDLSADYLGHSLARGKVETITIKDSREVPENAIESWDASEQQNGNIMAYLLDEDNNGEYELYIGQFGGVNANPDSSYLFYNFRYVTSINGLENLHTSNVTNMEGMFYWCYKLTTIDLIDFDISKVTSKYFMFEGMPSTAKVYVSDEAKQQWILGMSSPHRPSAWTTDNVIAVNQDNNQETN